MTRYSRVPKLFRHNVDSPEKIKITVIAVFVVVLLILFYTMYYFSDLNKTAEKITDEGVLEDINHPKTE